MANVINQVFIYIWCMKIVILGGVAAGAKAAAKARRLLPDAEIDL